MITYCNFSPDPVWVRESENGISHATLRRNITEQDKTNPDGTVEKQYQFEETDIYIPDRDNLSEYINSNFETLFMNNFPDYQKAKIQQINDACNSTIYAGFKATNGHTYKFDANYQANFTGGLSMLNADPTIIEIPFNTQDAGLIMQTRSDFTQTCKDSLNFKMEMLTRYFALQAQVLGATDYGGVDDVNW